MLTILNVTFRLFYFPYQIVGASVVRGNNSNIKFAEVKRFIQLVVNVCMEWFFKKLLLLFIFIFFTMVVHNHRLPSSTL